MKNIQNTNSGRNTWNEEEGLFFPGKVSLTEAKIYKWVVDNFGRYEAEDPSWNIHALAQYLDNTKELKIREKEGYVSYECTDKASADDFNEEY